MIDIDKWQEIFSTIQKNKLRTGLTMFSVFWGIFILIILLGFGTGLENGVKTEFEGDATNSIWIYSGQTSLAYKGLQPGRQIQFTNNDYDQILKQNKGLEYASSRVYIWENKIITYKDEYGSFDILSVHPDTKHIEQTEIREGRFVNDIDIRECRKVTAISTIVKETLFKDKPAVGEFVKVNGVPFRVVGVFFDKSEWDNRRVYLPVSTSQKIFNRGVRVDNLSLTTKLSVEGSQKLVDNLKKQFAKRHTFNPEDKRAIWIRNNVENYKQMMGLFAGIKLFVGIIGIFTIIAGVVGVSNIMIIVVKERTKEIGIRKAIGATPKSVIGLILKESILITGIAGYSGLLVGVGLLELLSKQLSGIPFIKDPQVDFLIAISATLLLIICGAMAGLFPAMRAAKIKPVLALRDE